MTFFDQHAAKSFFIEKAVSQAQKNGVNLSEAERYMLAWSESDPSFIQNPTMTQAFQEETSDRAFEEKVIALLKHAFDNDVKRDEASKQEYKEAFRVLNKGDHYLIVMIEEALGSKLKKWWFF